MYQQLFSACLPLVAVGCYGTMNRCCVCFLHSFSSTRLNLPQVCKYTRNTRSPVTTNARGWVSDEWMEVTTLAGFSSRPSTYISCRNNRRQVEQTHRHTLSPSQRTRRIGDAPATAPDRSSNNYTSYLYQDVHNILFIHKYTRVETPLSSLNFPVIHSFGSLLHATNPPEPPQLTCSIYAMIPQEDDAFSLTQSVCSTMSQCCCLE